MTNIDQTHDPKQRSWIPSANTPGTDFPIQNLPLGRYRRAGSSEVFRIGIAIGDQGLELSPTQRLDYELELGFFAGAGNALGEPIGIGEAEQHLFGVCLLNDWSARDVQSWEYQPLGPFLSKNFATTVSPWIVTIEALAPFRAPFVRPAGDPQPLPYLDSPANREHGALDITLEVWLQTQSMRDAGQPPTRLMQSNF